MKEMLPNYLNIIVLNATKEKSRLLGEGGWVGELIQSNIARGPNVSREFEGLPKVMIFKLALKDE